MSYREKRREQPTGRWYGEVRLRKLFKTKASADYSIVTLWFQDAGSEMVQ
jgi:hypothetical protein